jgi:hypothetical protein
MPTEVSLLTPVSVVPTPASQPASQPAEVKCLISGGRRWPRASNQRKKDRQGRKEETSAGCCGIKSVEAAVSLVGLLIDYGSRSSLRGQQEDQLARMVTKMPREEGILQGDQ